MLNCLPSNKVLDWTKLKAFADEKVNGVQMMISLCKRVENTVVKGEYPGYHHVLLFPQCLPEPPIFRVVKSWDCVVKS